MFHKFSCSKAFLSSELIFKTQFIITAKDVSAKFTKAYFFCCQGHGDPKRIAFQYIMSYAPQ